MEIQADASVYTRIKEKSDERFLMAWRYVMDIGHQIEIDKEGCSRFDNRGGVEGKA
jgi:hypothetical protein